MGSTRTEPMGSALALWSWSVILSVAVGLFFLYKTTTADPGYIQAGVDTHRKQARRPEEGSEVMVEVVFLSGRERVCVCVREREREREGALWPDPPCCPPLVP
jgi:hypothetical protein